MHRRALLTIAIGLLALLAPRAPLAAAEPRVTLIYGQWLPGEGGEAVVVRHPLQQPFGVDFDAVGTMWIVELAGGRVHRLDAQGQFATLAGNGTKGHDGDGGPASRATFNGMHNVAVTPGGDVYISDSWNYCVRRIDAKSGHIHTMIGTGRKGYTGDDGPMGEAAFSFVMCVTLNATKDRLYLTDIDNRRIRVADLKTGRLSLVAGDGRKGVPKDGDLSTRSPLVDPRAAAPDSKGNVYILERGGHALRVVDGQGRIRTVAGTGQKGDRDGVGTQASFGAPKHLCVDDRDNVYIADEANGRIRKFDAATGKVSTVLGQGRVKLLSPHGVTWHRGRLYVVDTGHHRILRVE